MLTDDKIINIIKEYEREYAILRKDSDTFHKILATPPAAARLYRVASKQEKSKK